MRSESEVHRVSGVDLLVGAFARLSETEQERALKACHARRLETCELGNSEASLIFRSLRRRTDELGEFPGVDQYRNLRRTNGSALATV